jgi:RNA polymerase sigma-70 factor (ECF subfamily)
LEDVAITDPGANAEQQAIQEQQRRAVRAAVAALPDLDRQCLYLRAEGLRYRDIAEALEISLGSVAASLSRALDRLSRVARR